MKYYMAQNAGRGSIGGVIFEITSLVAGTAWGVYATENEKEVAALDELVKDKRHAVFSISKEEHGQHIEAKKKANNLSSFSSSNSWQSPPPGPQLNQTAKPAVIIEGGPETPEEEKPVEITKALENVEDALVTDQVAPPAQSEAQKDPEPPASRRERRMSDPSKERKSKG